VQPGTESSTMERFLTGPERALTRFGELPRYREGLYEVGRDAYAWLVPNGSWGETNLGLVVCGKQSVLIDTCWDLRFTREALAAAHDLLKGAPIEYVINTHSDGDHCWGNQLFADKPIVATEACVRQFHHQKPWMLRYIGALGEHLAGLHGTGLDAFGHYMHQMLRSYDFHDLKLTPPNQPFSRERLLEVAGVELVISEIGPGHSAGDCMVLLPDPQVLYAGDVLFVDATPVAWAGPVENIVAALKRVLALRVRVIVPGHGRLATREDVQRGIDYWEFVQTELWSRFRSGMPSHEAARDVVLSERFQASVFASWDSPERLVTSACTLYRNWGARTCGLLGMLRRQAQLALALPGATPRLMHRFAPDTALASVKESRGAF
jgi:cyclase